MTAPKTQSTAVATIAPEARSFALSSNVGKILTEKKALAAILPLIPHGVDYEVVVAEAYRATVNNPAILDCTPESIIQSVAMVVQTGLTIGKTIHLVPMKVKGTDVLQAWTDYKGDIELVLRSGAARLVDGQVVYDGDVFDMKLGTNPEVIHSPTLNAKKRGEMLGAYAYAVLNSSGTMKKVSWLTLDEIEAVRAKSRSWSPSKVATCPDWYAIKTAIHRVCKTLPKNEKLAAVIALLDRQEAADQIADAEVVDAEITDAATYPLRPQPDAPAPAAAEPKAEPKAKPARPSPEQLERIAKLLDNPAIDIDDDERERIAGRIFTAETIEAEIERLAKLVPQDKAKATTSPNAAADLPF